MRSVKIFHAYRYQMTTDCHATKAAHNFSILFERQGTGRQNCWIFIPFRPFPKETKLDRRSLPRCQIVQLFRRSTQSFLSRQEPSVMFNGSPSIQPVLRNFTHSNRDRSNSRIFNGRTHKLHTIFSVSIKFVKICKHSQPNAKSYWFFINRGLLEAYNSGCVLSSGTSSNKESPDLPAIKPPHNNAKSGVRPDNHQSCERPA